MALPLSILASNALGGVSGHEDTHMNTHTRTQRDGGTALTLITHVFYIQSHEWNSKTKKKTAQQSDVQHNTMWTDTYSKTHILLPLSHIPTRKHNSCFIAYTNKMLATHILCYRYVNILDCRHTDSSVYVCRTSLHTVGIFTVLSFCHLYCNTAATCPLQLCVWVFCVWVFCVWVSVLTGPSSGGHLYCLAASIACGRPVAIQVTPWSPSTVSKWLHELVDSIWLQSYIKNCHRNMWMSGREREWVSDLVPRFILLGLTCIKTLSHPATSSWVP